MEEPFKILNADGSKSGQEKVTEYVNLIMEAEGHREKLQAVVTQLDSADMFLGHDWLVQHNPEVD
ncbi:hypothetical protein AN958_00169 [Leucoagaricus sp. SymC.cos]|nr:hypothetical protein AN958_06146 [Leucoagaricus sp. SymC.cos]KXN93245.1 hypothetical protein AN958_00169 [Leucoagaricus sp. SymC.cos]